MIIATWNVNGIRSLKSPIVDIIQELGSHITCFQETKISRGQLPESLALIDGHSSYFSYPRKQSGYSGVATYCSNAFTPVDAQEGFPSEVKSRLLELVPHAWTCLDTEDSSAVEFDCEGRVLTTYYLIKYANQIKKVAVINVYCPRVDPEKLERHLYKMQFCYFLQAATHKLCSEGCSVIIVGDLNIAHCIIDHCDPGDSEAFNSSETRQWLNTFLSTKFSFHNEIVNVVDAFRHFYPDRKEAYTCWNTKTGARQTNYGSRIDYILMTSDLLPILNKCELLCDCYGSDHCPVIVKLLCDAMPQDSARLPPLCTRMWPEFSGTQRKLQTFFQKSSETSQKESSEISQKESGTVPLRTKMKASVKKSSQKSIVSFFKNSTPTLCSEPSGVKTGADSTVPCENADDTTAENETCMLNSSQKSSQSSEWKSVFKGPPKPPVCSGHQKASVLRTVKKKGPNCGRQFYMCAQPIGPSTNPESNCNFFQWYNTPKESVLKCS